jgi:DNA modification methylase
MRYAQIENDSIDVIITDPPYPKEYLPLYEILAKEASRVLKPGGSLIVMTGQSYLPEILSLMTPHIRYHWTVSYLTPGGQSAQIWHRKVNTFWKPLLWFVKGEYSGGWIGDVTKSAVNDNDKRFHNWGQSESGMVDIVERFSMPGQTILDPFLGGGTTAVVAVKLGRYFIGIDQDPAAIQTTALRLAEIT